MGRKTYFLRSIVSYPPSQYFFGLIKFCMGKILRTAVLGILFLTLFNSNPVHAQRITAFAGGQIDGRVATDVDIAQVRTMDFAPDGDLILLQSAPFTGIRRIDSETGMVTRILGNGYYYNRHPAEGALAINSEVSSPQELIVDDAGNIYFSHSSTITRIDATTGILSRYAGGNYPDAYHGDDGPALEAGFSTSVYGMAIDDANNLYVCDMGNRRIRKIDGTTGIVTTIAGNGTSTPSGDGGPATEAGMIPADLHLAGDILYVGDYSNHRVSKIDLNTGIITHVAGTGTSGYSGDGGAGTAAKLNSPGGMTSDEDFLYICDGYNHRVRRVDLTTGIIDTYAGTGSGVSSSDAAATTTAFALPGNILRDADGNIIVQEYQGRRIRKINPAGEVTTIAGNGGFGGDGGLALNATLLGPDGMLFDLNGDFIFSDSENSRIRKITTSTGIVSTIAGTGAKGFSGDGGPATLAQFDSPGDLAIDNNGNLFIRDRRNYRIRMIDAVSGNISTVAGSGLPGSTGDGGQATDAKIPESGGIAVDAAGDIYFTEPSYHKVRKVTKTTGVVTTIAGTGVSGATGDEGPAVDAQVAVPNYIALDADGNIYFTVTEIFDGKIRRIDAITGVITTIAGHGFSGSVTEGPALLTYMPELTSLNFSPPDKLLIGSSGRVLEMDLTANTISILAGTGGQGHAGDGGPAYAAWIHSVASVLKDADGIYFICDDYSNRIRKVSPRAPQTITFNPLPATAFGDAPIDLSTFVSASSGLPVYFQSSHPSTASIEGSMLIIKGAGTIDITANQNGDDGFLEATEVVYPFTIGKGTPTIAINSPKKGRAGTYLSLIPHRGQSNGTAVFSVTNGTGTATVSGMNLNLLTPGTVTVTLTVEEGTRHLQASTQQDFTIEKPLPQLAFTSSSNGIVGDVIGLTVDTGTSTGAVSFSVESINGEATLDGSNLTLEGAGTVAITATIAEDATHASTSFTDLITIAATDTQENLPQIWGTASQGGVTNGGVIFRMNGDGTGYRVMKEFKRESLGSGPFYNNMSFGADGLLYGTMPSGGKYNSGVLYKYDHATSQYTVLHHFPVAYASPTSGLCLASDGNLYGTTEAGGADGGVVYRLNPSNGEWTKIGDLTANGTGRFAHGGLVEAANGKLYGVSSVGGASGSGAVYTVDPATSTLSIVLPLTVAQGSFSYGGLAVGPDGKLYGLSTQGGANGAGTIYEVDLAVPSITTKVDLPSPGASNSIFAMTLASNDKFYFTAAYGDGYGTIMEYVPGSTTVTNKHSFSAWSHGSVPFGGLTKAADGKLYGIASNGGIYSSGGNFAPGGTLFEFDPVTADATSLYHFNPENGIFPTGTMAVLPDGTLLGTTMAGGLGNGGVVFSFKPSTNQFIREVELGSATDSFAPSGAVAMLNGKLYGTARGANGTIVWEYDVATGAYKKRRDFDLAGSGAYGFMVHDGKLFGAAQNGGVNGTGSIYEFKPATGELLGWRSFAPANGDNPSGNLLSFGGKIYGTTSSGGTNDNGTVFSYDPATHAIVTTSLAADMGSQSLGLTLANDGMMYGVTKIGGANGGGTIYRFDPSNSSLTKLKDFSSTEGSNPTTRLTTGNTGKLYGLTSAGGAGSSGVLYEIDPATGAFDVSVDFAEQPASLNMVRGYNGRLYGATAGAQGRIFEFIPSVFGSDYEGLMQFSDVTGHTPMGEWVFAKADQTITFNALNPVRLFSTADMELEAESSSGLSVEYTSSDPTIAEVVGNTVRFYKVGTVTITASQDGDTNFNPAPPVERELVITKAEQAIVFFPMGERKAGEVFEPSVVSTSHLDIALTSANESIASIEGNMIRAHAVGTVEITATQAGDDTFLPATAVTATLTVVIGDQTIAFEPPDDVTMGFAPFALVATASSGLPVVFSSTSDKVTITGNMLTGVKPGRPVIKADQSGNDNYAAAVTVEQSFCINPAKPIVTSTREPSGNAVLTSSADAGNQWMLAGEPIEGATNKTLTVSEVGSYTVIATVDDCVGEESASIDILITGMEDSEFGLRLYPNPAAEKLVVERRSSVDERVNFIITDMLGRVILQQTTRTNTEEIIDLEKISQGAYLLKAVSGEGSVVRRWDKR
jgi:uncharacterized repeat protein (TIGR03803 family)